MKILAYGSLLNIKSLERTLKRQTILKKIILPNVKRVFNAPFGNYAFLNLQRQEGEYLEAAYFNLPDQEIERFAEREAGSLLSEIIPGFYAFVWPSDKCRNLPVLQSYIDVCILGAEKVGVNFWKCTEKPKIIINDRSCPKYV